MNAPEVVRRYAATLLETAAEASSLEQVAADVEGVGASIGQSAELVDFLRDPLVDASHKGQALEQVFGGKVEELTLNFLLLVAQRRRANVLPEILDAFAQLHKERQGRVTADVVSAVALSEGQIDQLQQRLSAYTGKDVVVEWRLDAGLKGGMIARIGDTVFDGSLGNHLQNLRRRLAGA